MHLPCTKYILTGLLIIVGLSIVPDGSAQNPFITDQFTADPSARVFNNTVYVFPSHDILASEGKGRIGWFCMEDYHVFSSSNLTDWTDHGVIVKQNAVPWVKKDSYNMWAPDCIFRNGKYYFYFPATPQDTTDSKLIQARSLIPFDGASSVCRINDAPPTGIAETERR